MPYQTSVDFLIPYLKERNSKLNIYIHSVAELKEIIAKKDKYSDDSISWLMPVSSEKDLSVISNMETMNNLQILPFYTGDNLKFFEDYVYMSLYDLLEAPITKKIRYYPFRVGLILKEKEGQIALEQIQTVSKEKLIKKIGILPNESHQQIC